MTTVAAPGEPWEHKGFGMLVEDAEGEWIMIEDVSILDERIRGVINDNQTPVQEKTWSQIKRLFVEG